MIIDLTTNIKVVRPEAKSMYPYSNSIYVDDEIKMVIDAGAGGTAYTEIKPENIDLLLLSHYHFDHTHCTPLFSNARIMAGKEEARIYSDQAEFVKFTGLLEWPTLMGDVEYKNEMVNLPYPDDVPSRPGFRLTPLKGDFEDGTSLRLGKTEVKTIHTPGHTRGHYAFWFEKEGVLFSGDLDLSPRGPWYGDGCSNVDEIIASVEKLVQIEPAILVTSHRRVFNNKEDNIRQKFRDYIGIILSREEKILNYLNEPRSIEQIVDHGLAYHEPVKFGQNILFWNRVMVFRHLQRLIRLGRAKEIEKGIYIRT